MRFVMFSIRIEITTRMTLSCSLVDCAWRLMLSVHVTFILLCHMDGVCILIEISGIVCIWLQLEC